VLGVSLPWKSIFNNEGCGARLLEQAKKSHKQISNFSCSHASPLSNRSLSSENVQPPTLLNSSSNNWLDLLTGDGTISDPAPLPVMEKVDKGQGDSSLDNPFSERTGDNTGPWSSAVGVKQADNGARQYINCLKSLAGPQMVCLYRFLFVPFLSSVFPNDNYISMMTSVGLSPSHKFSPLFL